MKHSKVADGFFVTQYSDRSAFVGKALKTAAEHAGVRITRLDARVDESGDQTGSDSLYRELSKAIYSCGFIVADITPSREGSRLSFNPNVMYEIGRAFEVGVPQLTVMEKPPEGLELPFDIAQFNTKLYDFSPDGLSALQNIFQQWLQVQKVFRYSAAQPRLRRVQQIYRDLHSFDGLHHSRFGPLLDVIFDRVEFYASAIRRAAKGAKGEFPFMPLSRSEMVDEIFSATLATLTEGDRYETLSTIEFWRHLREHRGRAISKFQKATSAALGRGVAIKRLMLVNPNSRDLDACDRVARAHETLKKRFGTLYDLAFLVPRNEAEYYDLRAQFHLGIFQIDNSPGEAFVLVPEYDGEKGERLTNVAYVLQPQEVASTRAELEALWSEPDQITSTWAAAKKLIKKSM